MLYLRKLTKVHKMPTWEVKIKTEIIFRTCDAMAVSWENVQPLVADMQRHAAILSNSSLPNDVDYLKILGRQETKILEYHYQE